jgi:hypothetical protein
VGDLQSGAQYDSATTTLYLSGKENADTDEYDTQVFLHEWSHYFMDKFSRDDSLGGTHRRFEAVDPRVAFSEGFATAFAAMMSKDAKYVDTVGRAQSRGTGSDIELDNHRMSSYYSELGIQELLWDLFDGTGVEVDQEYGHSGPHFDAVELGVGPIYEGMRKAVRNTPAFTTIFALLADVLAPINADPLLKTTVGQGILDLAHAENMFPETGDEFEQATRMLITSDPPPACPPFCDIGIHTGRLYTPVEVDASAVTRLFGPGTPYDGQQLTTNTRLDFQTKHLEGNKLEEWVFFKFNIPTKGKYRIFVDKLVPAQAGSFLLAVNVGDGTNQKIEPANNGGHPELFPCLEAGVHVAAVSAYVEVGGKSDPLTSPFTIRVAPAGSCTP